MCYTYNVLLGSALHWELIRLYAFLVERNATGSTKKDWLKTTLASIAESPVLQVTGTPHVYKPPPAQQHSSAFTPVLTTTLGSTHGKGH